MLMHTCLYVTLLMLLEAHLLPPGNVDWICHFVSIIHSPTLVPALPPPLPNGEFLGLVCAIPAVPPSSCSTALPLL